MVLSYLTLQRYSKEEKKKSNAKIFLNTYLLASEKAERDGIFFTSFKPNKNLIGFVILNRKNICV